MGPANQLVTEITLTISRICGDRKSESESKSENKSERERERERGRDVRGGEKERRTETDRQRG